MLWLLVVAAIAFFLDWRLAIFLVILAVAGYMMTVWQRRPR